MHKKRVFVVDDNPRARWMVCQLFESETNYEIAGEAENGLDAIEKATLLKPDLIVLDLNMPVMGGLDAAPLLRKALPKTPVILFTIDQGPELERLANEAGTQAIVSKDKAASELIPCSQTLLSVA